VLGYRYDDSPIVAADGTAPPARDFFNYVPTARPGALAPHAWLHDGRSLYDLFGTGFTALATGAAEAGVLERVGEAAAAAGVPLATIAPAAPALPDLYRARYALIRPDQHVAWRGDRWPDRLDALFAQVTGRGPS